MKDRLPYVEVSGSHRDIGTAIGEQMSDVIREDVENFRPKVPDYASLLEKSIEYYLFTKQVFPHLIEEVDALAAAARVSVYDYFFMNNREVYDFSENLSTNDSVKPDHCTIAVSFNEGKAIVGHNEDWDVSAINDLYILKATIGEVAFLGVNYACTVPGVAGFMNNFGLVQCINDLYQTNQFGVPKNFLARAVLECKTLKESENLIQSTPKASGFNHVLVQGDEVYNIEIAGSEIDTQIVTGQPYVHTNHYLSPQLKSLERFHTESSVARYHRASELVRPGMESSDMMKLLSDTNDSEHPICREQETIASLVFELHNGLVHICKGHPCAGTYYTYTL